MIGVQSLRSERQNDEAGKICCNDIVKGLICSLREFRPLTPEVIASHPSFSQKGILSKGETYSESSDVLRARLVGTVKGKRSWKARQQLLLKVSGNVTPVSAGGKERTVWGDMQEESFETGVES